MIDINEIIMYARENKCSDIHLTSKLPPVFRKNGDIFVSDMKVEPGDIERIILSMLSKSQIESVNTKSDLDFCYTLPNGLRQRVNIYHQNKSICSAIRILNDEMPTFESLNLPPVIQKLSNESRGLILVTGPTGSGKSTTLAAMIDYINRTRKSHILTIEDPIEYMHTHKKSIVHQREVGEDVDSFSKALRSALREDPDVILVGEMRDLETISAAITAAETGHLVLSTLHTTGAANTIDRIVDVFPSHNQSQIRVQLASVLKGVITQQLVPKVDGSGRIGAFEIMIGTDAVLNLVRESKCHQISSMLQTGMKDGMCSLNWSLANMVSKNIISMDQALKWVSDKNEFFQLLN
ncbi:MAG: type IV pilus twitching motility protein PilT [Proteocatella sp.]